MRTRIFRFPDARVWGKHSTWQSTHHRAEARTHYLQKHGAQKPSSGRKGDHEVVEGARVTFSLREFYCHALSLSRLRRQLPLGGSLSHIPTDRKHHQRKFLGGVRFFSAKYAEPMSGTFYQVYILYFKRRLSAIIAINSLFVGFPRLFCMVYPK